MNEDLYVQVGKKRKLTARGRAVMRDRVVRAYRAGFSLLTITSYSGLSSMTVRTLLREEGVSVHPPGLRRRNDPDCPEENLHTEQPTKYVEWQAWADKMAVTHTQRMCPGCSKWMIWEEKLD